MIEAEQALRLQERFRAFKWSWEHTQNYNHCDRFRLLYIIYEFRDQVQRLLYTVKMVTV